MIGNRRGVGDHKVENGEIEIEPVLTAEKEDEDERRDAEVDKIEENIALNIDAEYVGVGARSIAVILSEATMLVLLASVGFYGGDIGYAVG